MTTSKDKTLKFWRFKQLRGTEREIQENSDIVKKTSLGQIRKPQKRSDSDGQDPLNSNYNDAADSYQQSKSKQDLKIVEKTSESLNQKQIQKKKEESDDDLAGWDT